MAQYTTEAIVLGVHNWGAADKMVWLLSPEHGKLKAAAYGCRRPKSPLAGGLQLFNRLDVSLNSGSQLDTLRQCTMKGRYRKVGEDLTVMAYAAFVAELTLELLPEGMPQPDIYQRLLEILAAFETRNPRLVALAAACVMPCHDRANDTISCLPVTSLAMRIAASFDSAPVVSSSTFSSGSGSECANRSASSTTGRLSMPLNRWSSVRMP